MNGLLISAPFSHDTKPECRRPRYPKRYQTWPRRQKLTRKQRICSLISRLKRERAISELNLAFENSKAVHHYLNHGFSTVYYDNNNCVKKNSRCKHIYGQEYDRKTKEDIADGTKADDCGLPKNVEKDSGTGSGNGDLTNRSSSSTPSEENIFDENKLGIVRILKNWKLSKDNYTKYSADGNAAYSDTRSSISSIATLTETDSIGYGSDIAGPTYNVPRYTEHQHKIISSSHLIQLDRPDCLPPKPIHEQRKHQKEYEKMVEDRKKREQEKDSAIKKQLENRLKEEEKLNQETRIWLNEILPNWKQTRNSKKTQNLWWNGLPPRVRGQVWSLSVGNSLNITSDIYVACVKKSKEILETNSRDSLQTNDSYEHSVELIRLDISRTFPHLCIFQQGGPYYDVLHSVLGAYVCYQPDVGYVQGMSFIAAVLLLNMEELDAFICFANLLNKPCHKAFYSLDVRKMRIYYSAYTDLLRVNIYDLYRHVTATSLTPDLYLVDWVYTLFSKSTNLDLACRIWDLIVRDGESFIFRAALGIMHVSRKELLKMDFLRAAQYLTKLPENMCPHRLFKSISAIKMSNGSYTFEDLLQYYTEFIR